MCLYLPAVTVVAAENPPVESTSGFKPTKPGSTKEAAVLRSVNRMGLGWCLSAGTLPLVPKVSRSDPGQVWPGSGETWCAPQQRTMKHHSGLLKGITQLKLLLGLPQWEGTGGKKCSTSRDLGGTVTMVIYLFFYKGNLRVFLLQSPLVTGYLLEDRYGGDRKPLNSAALSLTVPACPTLSSRVVGWHAINDWARLVCLDTWLQTAIPTQAPCKTKSALFYVVLSQSYLSIFGFLWLSWGPHTLLM